MKQKILLLLEEALWVDTDEDKEIIDMTSSQLLLPKETMEMPVETSSGKINI